MGASNSTEVVKSKYDRLTPQSWREKRESELIKGQLISKGIFGVLKSTKKRKFCISALASKRGRIKKLKHFIRRAIYNNKVP